MVVPGSGSAAVIGAMSELWNGAAYVFGRAFTGSIAEARGYWRLPWKQWQLRFGPDALNVTGTGGNEDIGCPS